MLAGTFATAADATPGTAYVTDFSGKSVTPIDLTTNTPGPEIKVGSEPQGIAITPDGKTAYVTSYGSKSVTPINLETNEAGAEITVGSDP